MQQIALLYRPESLCRSGIAREYNQGAAHIKKHLNTFPGVLVDSVEGTVAVRRARIIAQVNIIVSRKQVCNRAKDREAAIARIENTYGLFF